MADKEQRLHDILDVVEQARREGDAATEAKATAAYRRESQQPAPASLFDQAKASIVNTGADIYRGITSLPTTLLNIPAEINNAYYRNFQPQGYDVRQPDGSMLHRSGMVPTASEQQEQALTRLGATPLDQRTGLDSVVGSGVRAASSVIPMAAGARVLQSLPGVAGEVWKMLAGRPTLQAVSAFSSGASSDIARQAGWSPLGQFGAGLAGGIVPGLVAPNPGPAMAPARPSNSAAAQATRSSMGYPAEAVASAGANAAADANVAIGPATAEQQIAATANPQIRATTRLDYGTPDATDPHGLSVPKERIAQQGQELGMRLTPGQRSGSVSLMQMEAKAESQPGTSGPFNRIKQTNQTVLNRVWARAIGERSNTVDSDVLGQAKDRLTDVFEGAGDERVRQIDPRGFVEFLHKLLDENRGLVRGLSSHPLIEDLTSMAESGNATGHQLQSLTSKLGKAAYKEMTTQAGDRDLGIALGNVKDYVDEILMQGMNPVSLKEFTTARQQYRNLMLLLRPGVVNTASGDVKGGSMASLLARVDRNGYALGKNESPHYTATRFAKAFEPIVGNSGTATRMPMSLTEIAAAVPMNIGARAYLSTPSVNASTRAVAAANALSEARTNALANVRSGVRAGVSNDTVLPVVMGASEDRKRRNALAETK
jgi:hypothetical protein